MILLFDIGNTNTHLGVASAKRVVRQMDLPTADWFDGGRIRDRLLSFARRDAIESVLLCSVVPRATPLVLKAAWELWRRDVLELTPRTLRGLGIDYPRPASIGPDRLANSLAARHLCGAPVVVVDFGTAVTFDVVNRKGDYIGGIIAPGLSAMTDYLHEKTALLPRIRIREIRTSIGRSTEQAMVVGAVHGYRGLVRELLMDLKKGRLKDCFWSGNCTMKPGDGAPARNRGNGYEIFHHGRMLLRCGAVHGRPSADSPEQLSLRQLPQGCRRSVRCLDHDSRGELPDRSGQASQVPHRHAGLAHVLRRLRHIAHV
jgi:type III pantothenate kinase